MRAGGDRGTELVRRKEKVEVSLHEENKLDFTAVCSNRSVGELESLVQARGGKFWLHIWKKI